ncbi:MAG: hypothetical protein HOP33_00870 [Verrucomicrobia bacterium]|nr:hypothetical protein [Verrucomicrobiota bacterium]
MKPSSNPSSRFGSTICRLCAGILAVQLTCVTQFSALAQTTPKEPESKVAVAEPGASAKPPGTSDASLAAVAEATGSSTNKDAALKAGSDAASSTNEIQVSFQGANIDMIVQWLAQNTGKSVVKSPQAQCQLTIVSSKKVTPREAIGLIYRALSLEGISVVESSKFIFIVPEGKEPKMNPELIDTTRTNIPDGRQRLIKIFPLKYVQAAEMKERVKGLLSEKATVEVDAHVNQIIVTDFNDNLTLVGDIISALDTDQPGDVAMRMIPLKHVSAQELVKEISPLYQKLTSKSQKEMVEIAANDRSNSLIILSGESDFKAILKLVAMLDTEEAQEKATETFQLKNADAMDVAKQLKDLNQDQDSSSRYPFYMFGGGSPSSKSQKKFSVVADRRRNSIIVQATPSAMDGIAKMVAALDEPVTDESLAPKLYQLKYVSAVDMEDVLNELFLKKKDQQRPYWYYDESPPETPDRDVGRLYGKVRITSEPHANVIILTSNSKESVEAVEAILKQLDVPSSGGESTLRIGLQFAKASVVANNLNILFAKNGSPPLRAVNQPSQPGVPNQPQQQQQSTSSRSGFDLEQESKEDGYFPWLGGQPDNPRSGDGRSARPVSDLVGRVRAVADQRGNALLVSANVHFFPQVLKLIEELDAPSDQVLIEARLVEVSSDFLDKLGVRWSPDGSKVFTADDFDNSLLAHATAQYQKGFGGNTTVNTPSSSSVAQGLASLRSGVLSSSLNMDFLVQFLRKTTDATVLAEPQLNIRDNETGKLFVGQQVPVPDTTQVSSVGSQNTSIKYRDVGVVLEVTPHINSAGDVELRIHAESSTVVPGQTVLGGAIFDTRNFRTDLTAKNGQTLILGGIIQRQISDTLRKTPILGSIPVVKWAFNKKDKTTRQVELMVFLRPRVVRNPEEARELMQDVGEKAPMVHKWQDGIPPETKGKKRKQLPKD